MLCTSPPQLDPERDALFLDFDGTLVHFADRPEDVEVPDSLRSSLIRASERLGGAVALVSGRSVSSLDQLLAPLRLPAAGVHGLEFRTGEEVERNESEMLRLTAAREVIAADLDPLSGISVEDKGGAIVLHYRTAPAAEGHARELARRAAAADAGLVAVDGHAIAEIRPRAITKAGAIQRFLRRPPFAGRRPVFAGDDVTDEDGFAAVQEAGGYGVKVGSGDTCARYGLEDVAAMRSWLGELAKE